MSDHDNNHDHDNDDVLAVRQMLAPLGEVDVDDLRARRIRSEAHRALARGPDGLAAGAARRWRRLEPAFAFAVASVYMTLALRAVISIY